MTIHLEEHRVFDNAEELNEAIRLHLRKHRYKLNKTAFTVLETISRYAVKYGGAAWLKGKTLADLVNKSEPTVRRGVIGSTGPFGGSCRGSSPRGGATSEGDARTASDSRLC